MAEYRKFDTGATRDTEQGKLDYEAFLSPAVLERYAQYLHRHRRLPDGSMRDGDNWQKGIPLTTYMKSALRHLMAWWKVHRGVREEEDLDESICALLFNAMGYLHEHLRFKAPLPTEIERRVDEDLLPLDKWLPSGNSIYRLPDTPGPGQQDCGCHAILKEKSKPESP